MKLENQCVSLEIAKRLKELGCTQESLFYWHNVDVMPSIICKHWHPERSGDFWISAYTVAELGEILPGQFRKYNQQIQLYREYFINHAKVGDVWLTDCVNEASNTSLKTFKCETEANARGRMLIYLLENKIT
jgi:hypothetical protein